MFTQGKVHVCAEIGINHNGDPDIARRLIRAAADAGADSVKFQKRAVWLIPEHIANRPKETPWGMMTYGEYKERIEFSIEEYRELYEHAHREGIPMFWSVWDIASLVAIKENFDPPAYKIPSAKITDVDYLKAFKRREAPLVMSTGMSTSGEIALAASTIIDQGNQLILCHCNSTYPCPKKDLNLRCIQSLQRVFPGLAIGYSGHEVGLATTLAAVALGAVYIERHITLDRAMWGTDQASSVEPQGFKRLVEDIHSIEEALGDGIKRVTPAEEEVKKKLRY